MHCDVAHIITLDFPSAQTGHSREFAWSWAVTLEATSVDRRHGPEFASHHVLIAEPGHGHSAPGSGHVVRGVTAVAVIDQTGDDPDANRLAVRVMVEVGEGRVDSLREDPAPARRAPDAKFCFSAWISWRHGRTTCCADHSEHATNSHAPARRHLPGVIRRRHARAARGGHIHPDSQLPPARAVGRAGKHGAEVPIGRVAGADLGEQAQRPGPALGRLREAVAAGRS